MFISRSTLIATAFAVSASAAATQLDERDLSECSTAVVAALPAITNVPTADSALASFIAKQTQFATVTDTCVIPAVTGSMSDEYTSWVSQLVSWQSEYKDEISSVLEACSDVPEIKSQLSSLPSEFTKICDKFTWEGGATAAAASNSDNAAPRETGLGLAAAAAAGIVVAGMF